MNPTTHYPTGAVRPQFAAPVPNSIPHVVPVDEYELATAIARNIVRDAIQELWSANVPALVIRDLEDRLSRHHTRTEAAVKAARLARQSQGGK